MDLQNWVKEQSDIRQEEERLAAEHARKQAHRDELLKRQAERKAGEMLTRAQEQKRLELEEAEAMRLLRETEAVPVKPHLLKENAPKALRLYIIVQLILLKEIPHIFKFPAQADRALQNFFKSLDIDENTQKQLLHEVSLYDDQAKKDALMQLTRYTDDDPVCCMFCDFVKLHGLNYKLSDDLRNFIKNMASGVLRLSKNLVNSLEKLIVKVASGTPRHSFDQFGIIPHEIVTYYLGKETADFIVIDLWEGCNANHYPWRYSSTPPTPNNCTCYTRELWLRIIPAGEFTMGSPEDEAERYADERQHNVTLTQDFFMGCFPVTQEQWELIMGTHLAAIQNETEPGMPMENVSFYDICGNDCEWPKNKTFSKTSFLGRLSARTGLKFQLPTEAQWEYACRAGSITERYGDIDNIAWYSVNSNHASQPVGKKQPNAWGLYDTLGNVYEWCMDRREAYPNVNVSDPLGGTEGDRRIYRGGSWNFNSGCCRAARRNDAPPDNRCNRIGLRLTIGN